MYNFHLHIKPSIKDTYARLGGPLHLELGFGITFTVQKRSFLNLQLVHTSELKCKFQQIFGITVSSPDLTLSLGEMV